MVKVGIKVKTDSKGRIVIPKDMRMNHDEFLIFGLPSRIVLKPMEKVEDPIADLEEISVDTKETVQEIKRRIRKSIRREVTEDVR